MQSSNIKGITINNAIGSFALQNGKVVSFNGNFITNISAKINTTVHTVTPEKAVRHASFSLGLKTANDIRVINKKSSAANSFLLSKSNVSKDEIPVALTYELKDDKLILCWDLSIRTKDGKNWYSTRVDANNGKLVSKNDWMLHCSFGRHSHPVMKTNNFSLLKNKSGTINNMLATATYNVFPIPVESPSHGDRKIISGKEDPDASPFGWHDTNGADGAEHTTTSGNNVIASEDLNGNDGIGNQPSGTANLLFDFPFDPTPNFTVGAFQDGSSRDNANFGTPPDGLNPRMQMFLWYSSNINFIITNTDLAGNYKVLNNGFDNKIDPPLSPNKITADLVLAIDDNPTTDPNNVCSDLTNSAEINEKIAVVRRGGCYFTDKVKKCQNAGALAVLVVNNIPGDISMGGGTGTTVPAISINQKDGDAIIAKMALETVNVSLSTKQSNEVRKIDGSFDNGIIMHEYGHGISTRLTGGPDTSGCLNNAEQMGEGWSDWFGLMLTIKPSDKGTDARGIGTYVKGKPITHKGIRPHPYSTDMTLNPVTYEDVKNETKFSIPHGIGSIWAAILWDLSWEFIARDGYDADLYNGKRGK